MTCETIRQKISERLAGKVFASGNGTCEITVPVRTPDNGFVTIYVQPSGNSFLIHDGGATDSQLFAYNIDTSQGGAKARRKQLMERFNVATGNGMMMSVPQMWRYCVSPCTSLNSR